MPSYGSAGMNSNGSSSNVGNTFGSRSSSRVLAPPGGGSSFSFGWTAPASTGISAASGSSYKPQSSFTAGAAQPKARFNSGQQNVMRGRGAGMNYMSPPSPNAASRRHGGRGSYEPALGGGGGGNRRPPAGGVTAVRGDSLEGMMGKNLPPSPAARVRSRNGIRGAAQASAIRTGSPRAAGGNSRQGSSFSSGGGGYTQAPPARPAPSGAGAAMYGGGYGGGGGGGGGGRGNYRGQQRGGGAASAMYGGGGGGAPAGGFGARTNSESNNAFASGANPNSGNFMTGRSSSRVLAPPGGRSNFSFG